MMSDEFVKKLNEESHKHATIPESQRYGVHFEYHDLVNRLNKVKKERERKTGANSSLDLRKKEPEEHLLTQRSKKRGLTNIYHEQLVRNTSEAALPNIKTPRTKIKPKFSIPAQSENNLRIKKINRDLKLHPLAKRPSIPF